VGKNGKPSEYSRGFVSLSFERRGSGEPLLLVHGLGGSTVVWRPVIERLARERDVIAIDMPGFGRSPAPPGLVPSAVNLARALVSFCAELGVERPHVAGNSLGGWVGLEMARLGRAASVCAISPAGLWRRPLGPRRYERQVVGRRIRPLISGLLRTRRGRAWLLRTTVARPGAVPAKDAIEVINVYLDAPAYPEANRLMREGAFEHAAEIDVPVTIAWGEEDRIVGHPSSSRLPPGVEVAVRPGWGHTPTWDDPEGVAELILEASAS
jgi:pimeloyl-ACP methyl ester carboxylesterase